MTDAPSDQTDAALQQRCAALVALFEGIARTRMLGVPVLNPALSVQALGFERVPADAAPEGGDEPAAGAGVLITPWFMNLIWLPLQHQPPSRAPGQSRKRPLGCETFDFMAAWDPVLGAYELCSLFSPMFDFADQAAASATAREVLKALRPAPGPTQPARPPPATPARRAFLFGRRP